MKCPICSERLLPGMDRCTACGYRMPRSSAPTELPPVSSPLGPARPKRRRGCCVLLILSLILGLLSGAFRLATYVIEDFSAQDFGINIYEETPVEDPSYEEPSWEAPPSASRPDAADESCFAIDGGVVYFLPDLWDGGPILTIPETVDGETVTAIGPGCFRSCEDLTTIILPDTVTEICGEAFLGCTKLRGLYLPFGMESIGEDAFAGCVDLEAICIPAAVTDIAPGCFDDCASLMYIIYEGSFEHWEELYDDYINPFTTAICFDGSFYHGTGR